MSIDISKIEYPIRDHVKNNIIIPANHFLIILTEVSHWIEKRKRLNDLPAVHFN
jgi:hypothetical protein